MNIEHDDAIPDPLRQQHITARVVREDIWRPANRKDDWRVFAIVGREGIGKSMTCVSILRACDPTFTVDNVHFEPVPFLNDIGRELDDSGVAVMSDETGVGFGNRTWHDRTQIEANQFLQTARDYNRVVGLTAPRLEELDKQLKGRLHVLVEVINQKTGDWVEVKWKRMEPSRSGQDKIYKKYPRAPIGNRVQKVTRLKIGPPPGELVEPYLAKKAEWKGELKDRVVEKYEDEASDSDDDRVDPEELAEKIADNGLGEYVSVHNQNKTAYLDRELIRARHDLSHADAKAVKSLIENELDQSELANHA